MFEKTLLSISSICCAFFLFVAGQTNYNCRFSPNAAEYSGSLSNTEAGIPCARWDVYRQHDNLTDNDFIDGSKIAANNYCRNPSGKYPWPWCYTTDNNVTDLPCEVPLCSSGLHAQALSITVSILFDCCYNTAVSDCRMTLIGMEYTGPINKTLSDHICEKWSEKMYRKYRKSSNISTSARELEDNKFGDGTRKKAANRCRNPTGDVNGPWCLIQYLDENGNQVYDKEYCQLNFCNFNSTECIFATSPMERTVHSHYIKLPTNKDNTLDLGLLLWNAADFNKAQFRIAITTLPVLLNGENLFKMETGIELLIRFPEVTFVSYPEEPWVQHTRIVKILSAVTRERFSFKWFPSEFYIEVTFSKSFRKADYADKNVSRESLFYLKKGEFTHYSIIGNVGHWTATCQDASACEEHVTLNGHCSKYYKKLQVKDMVTTMGTDYAIHFHVRSKATIYLELRDSPAEQFPYFRIEILGAFNKTTLQLFENHTSFPNYLSVVTYENVISERKWSEFTLSIVRDNFQLIWVRDLVTPEIVFTFRHRLFRNKQWFTFCSAGAATWLFDCSAEKLPTLPKLEGSECARTSTAADYEGTQTTTRSGTPCLPWIYPPVIEVSQDSPFSTGRLQALNYCRNPDEDSGGAYCFVADPNTFPALNVIKEYCDVPSCPLMECKFSGIGRDYDGSVNRSLSGRECAVSKDLPQFPSKLGFCRNPDRSRFGPYCHTTDANKKYDLCPVPDCEVNDNCTLIIETYDGLDRWIVVDPDWFVKRFRFKAKIWDPLTDNGLVISMFTTDRNPRYWISLSIGAQQLNRVQLSYITGTNLWDQVPILLKTKVIPRLIPKGYWQGFWLQLLPYSIELGYEDSNVPIISWTKPDDADLPAGVIMSKTPRTEYISFSLLSDRLPTPVGINVPCDYRLVERTKTFHEGVYFPINLWKTVQSEPQPLTVHVRAVDLNENPLKYAKDTISRVSIGFYEHTTTIDRHWLHVYTNKISFTRSSSDLTPAKGILSRNLSEPLIRHDQWTTFTFIYTENTFRVSYQHGDILNYTFPETSPFTPYYFTVLSTFIIATWTANYPPPDLDSYVNGSWGEWGDFECSVRCGGGFGSRYRECDNPKPSYKGYPCLGKPEESAECNRFECGCLNPTTVAKVNQSLLTSAKNIEVDQSKDIQLECSKSVIDTAKIDSPKSKIEWLKDGFRIDRTLMELEEVNLTSNSNYKLKNAQPDDAGVYTCVIYPECAIRGIRFIPITVIALVVRTATAISVRKKNHLKLECKSTALENVYKELSQSWFLNDLLFINYTDTELQEVSYDVIESVANYHGGTWECKIRHRTSHLEWITTRIEVEILDEPTLLSYFAEEDVLSFFFYFWNPTLILIFLIFIIICEIIAVVNVVLWFKRKRQELLNQTEFHKLSNKNTESDSGLKEISRTIQTT